MVGENRYKIFMNLSNEQLGNSVNVRILKILGESLFSLANKGWEGENDGSQV